LPHRCAIEIEKAITFAVRNRAATHYTTLRAIAMLPSTSKRTLIALAALVCLAAIATGFYLHRARRPLPAAAASPGPAPSVLSELPTDAPGIAYVDVAALRKLQDSPLAAVLGLADSNPASDRDYAEFVRGTGFDYTRDLDKAAIAFWLPAQVRASNVDIDRAVAIADGRFNQAKIKAYALRTGRVITRGNQSIYEVPGKPPVAFEFLSPTRIILASGKDPASLLGPFQSGRRDRATQALIDRVSGAPLFAVIRTDNLPPTFYDDLRSSPQLEGLARNVQGLTLAGQPKANDLQLALDAECDSMTHAIEMSTLLDGFRMLGSMALADPKTRREMTREQAALLTDLLGQAKITHQDRWVRLTLDVTPSMLGSSGADPRR
jgi:hypothetical protein